jgi:hypothetical protein
MSRQCANWSRLRLGEGITAEDAEDAGESAEILLFAFPRRPLRLRLPNLELIAEANNWHFMFYQNEGNREESEIHHLGI